jgi:hypothetical protein
MVFQLFNAATHTGNVVTGLLTVPPARPKVSHAAAAPALSRRAWLRIVGCGAAVGSSFLALPAIHAAEPLAAKATNSRSAREEAMGAIPYDKLPRETRGAVVQVVNNPSIYRRLPTQTIDCDPDLYLFLLRNPEVVVNIWRMMGITNMTLDRTTANRLRAADGQGTVGSVEYSYRSADTHVLYSEGSYDGPMYPVKLRGQCVLLLRSGYVRQSNGRVQITNQLDAFLHVDNLGIELVAKTLQPLLGKTADHNFAETATFLSTMSHTAEKNPNGIARLAARLTRLDPQVRDQFVDISRRVADNASAQAALAPAAHLRGSDTADMRVDH